MASKLFFNDFGINSFRLGAVIILGSSKNVIELIIICYAQLISSKCT